MSRCKDRGGDRREQAQTQPQLHLLRVSSWRCDTSSPGNGMLRSSEHPVTEKNPGMDRDTVHQPKLGELSPRPGNEGHHCVTPACDILPPVLEADF